jgi:hypothetical protein
LIGADVGNRVGGGLADVDGERVGQGNARRAWSIAYCADSGHSPDGVQPARLCPKSDLRLLWPESLMP